MRRYAGALLLALALVVGPTTAAHAVSDDQRKHRLAVNVPHTLARGQTGVVRVTERPVRSHRLLKLRYRPATGGAWRLAARTHETRHGKGRLRFALPATGTYTVRVTLARYRRDHQHVRLRQVYATVKVVPINVPLVIAHRGGAAEAPENTIAAFAHAIGVGAPVLETDVHETSDGKLVLMHDDTLARTTDAETVLGVDKANTKIWKLTSADVAQVHVDVGPGAPQPVPTFGDLLTLLQANPGVRLLAEAKDPGLSPGDLNQLMLDAMTAAGIDASRSGRAAIESFDVDGLQAFANAHPGVNVSPIMQKKMTAPQYYTWAGSITLESPYATPAQIAVLHAGGLPVNVWTVDSAADLATYADAGADAVITDAPTRAYTVYR